MWRAFVCICLVITCLLGGCATARPVEGLQVIAHPDGPLYVGDQVSFEVLAPAHPETQDDSIQVGFQGKPLGKADFAPFGLGKRNEAVFWWAWDTRSLKPGRYVLTFTRLSDKLTWVEAYSLHPADQVPPPQPGARWASITTTCCIIHYITGSAAARDILRLGQEADQESAAVSKQIGVTLDKPIDVTLMSRVLGQGGFTAGGVYLSYLDGNLAADDMPILFHHEFVHYYDAVAGGKYRPAFFEEGLAVFLSGGHFKPEPLAARASALLSLGRYMPLQSVADDFYSQQHEIGYLEAASLVEYLVETYGWGSFNQFYRDISFPANGQTDSNVIGAVLQAHFKRSFADLESAYLAYLRSQPSSPDQRADLRLTLEYYDTLRRYQAALDPSAYFLYAWLPDGSAMRQHGIVADLLRHPTGWDNRLGEFLLGRAHAELSSREYAAAGNSLQWTNLALDVLTH